MHHGHPWTPWTHVTKITQGMAVARFAQFNGRGRLWRQRSDVAARGWMGPAWRPSRARAQGQ